MSTEFQRVECEVLGGHPQQIRSKPYTTPEDLAPGEVSASADAGDLEAFDPFAAASTGPCHPKAVLGADHSLTSKWLSLQVSRDLGIDPGLVDAVVSRYFDLVVRNLALGRSVFLPCVGRLVWSFNSPRLYHLNPTHIHCHEREREFSRVSSGCFSLRLRLSRFLKALIRAKTTPPTETLVAFTPEEQEKAKAESKEKTSAIRSSLRVSNHSDGASGARTAAMRRTNQRRQEARKLRLNGQLP